jgi:hypothetical protein
MTTWVGLAAGLIVGFWAAVLWALRQRKRTARNDQGQQILKFVQRHGPTPLSEFTAEDEPELDAIVHQLHQQGDIHTKTRAGVVLVFPNPEKGGDK